MQKRDLSGYFCTQNVSGTFLFKTPFKLVTEQQEIPYSFKKIDVYGKLARWLDFLSEYEFEMEYCPGTGNSAAEYLLRVVTDDYSSASDVEENVLVATTGSFGTVANQTILESHLVDVVFRFRSRTM